MNSTNLPRSFMQEAYGLMDMRVDELNAEMTSHCESPIEVIFAVAFLLLGETNYGGTAFLERGYEKEVLPADFEFVLAAQRQIGSYRVDFVARWNGEPDRKRVIIECDGHSFHERTKEQAQRDKSRDRDLQSSGYAVFRFTGSEIYRNAFNCATEVYETLLKEAGHHAS